MNRIDLIARFEALSRENVETVRKKNSDYATDTDAFANFAAAVEVGVPVERGFLVRIMDKIHRASNLLDKEEPAVTEESLSDTLRDLSTYSLLLLIYLEQKAKLNMRCPYCGRPEIQGGGKTHDIAGHTQTICCNNIVEPCCDGASLG